MVEEEDWDAPAPTAPKAPTTSASNPDPHQTLRITDGYKYSYESLTSPANIEDWVEPSSYGGPRRSNGYGEGRPFRQERHSNNRFNPMKRNDSSPSGSYERTIPSWSSVTNTPQPSKRINSPEPSKHHISNSREEDWDAPTTNESNTSMATDIPNFRPRSMPSTPQQSQAAYSPEPRKPNIRNEEEDWDAPSGAADKGSTSMAADIPTYRPSSVANTPQQSKRIHSPEPSKSHINNDNEEDWDEPSGTSTVSKPQPVAEIPIYKPSSNHSSGSNSPVIRKEMPKPNSSTLDEENWDEDTPAPVSQDIPIFKPSSQTPDSVDQRTESNGSGKATIPKGFGERGFGGVSGDRGGDHRKDRGFGGNGGESRGFGRNGGESRGFGGSGGESRGFGGSGGESRGFGGSGGESRGFGGSKGFGGDNQDRDSRRGGGGGFRGGRGFGNRKNENGETRGFGGRGFGGGNRDRSFSRDRNDRDRGGMDRDRGRDRSFSRDRSDREGDKSSGDRGFGGSDKSSGERGFGDRGFGKPNDRFGSGDNNGFGREPFNNRHSRGNRHAPYERSGDRGDRGGRGGRGGRGSRGGFRENTGDRDWGNKPFGRSLPDRNRNVNSPSSSSPLPSFSKPVEEEEDWDAPSASAPKHVENKAADPKPASTAYVAPPVDVTAIVSQEEESWD